MARTKRKVNPIIPAPTVELETPSAFLAAGYVRLSTEDSGKLGADVIEAQKEMVASYIEQQPDMRLHKIYCDNGWTGTNFERPGFECLMNDVRSGKVNCIVVKDDCVIKARTPQTLENRHFLRIGTEFRAIQRPQRAAYHIETS